MVGLRETLATEGTLELLDQCIQEFERENAERRWFYESVQIADRRIPLTTRLYITTAPSGTLDSILFNPFDDRYWNVRASDVEDYLEYLNKDGSFCTIRAGLEKYDETGSRRNLLTIDFFRDCSLEAAVSSYPEFLRLLLEKLEQEGIIKEQPWWASSLSEDSLVTPGRGRGKNIDTALKVAKAELILEHLERIGMRNQQRACDLAGVAPKTYRKWNEHPDVQQEKERLAQDQEFQAELEEIGGF